LGKVGETNSDRAFSNLVPDNQYSALGLVLLGCLAQVKSVIGQLVEDEGLDGGIVEAEVDEGESMVREVEVADDFGEVVSREEVLGNGKESRDEVDEEGKDEQGQLGEQVQEETGEEAQEMTMARSGKKKRTGPRIDDTRLAEEILTPSKPPKKKRKKGDAFDDLFSGLI
jgi:ribonuclease MRP protein subunit RMP1